MTVLALTTRTTLTLFAIISLPGCAQQQSSKPVKHQGFRCSAYESHGEAQRAWKDAGEPAWADRDHDGVVCETQFSSRHARVRKHCRRQQAPVVVVLSTRRYPKTTQHLREAIQRGAPRILHIDREGAEDNRSQSLAGIPTKHGYDRDEYPPAMSREGGTGADVRYVPSADNRGAGFAMGHQLRSFCNGQEFRLVVKSF